MTTESEYIEAFDAGRDDAIEGRPMDDTWLETDLLRSEYRQGYRSGKEDYPNE